ncbi:MAG: peptidoglycan DD-metalloendopeptidase family protein [Cohaesibacter sp.]|nr:peptidoglycan DD-metalloendopeptidase family protein [Cohaesibacter sp.]
MSTEATSQLSEEEQKAARALEARLKARKDQQAQLDALEASIQLSGQKQGELEEEIARLQSDRETIQSNLIDTADRIKGLEASLSKSETRLKTLFQDETALRVSLAEQRDALSEILAALQRIGRNPPPALAIQPSDALSAVRSAILLSTLVPEIRVEAQALASQLEQLVTLKTKIKEESLSLKTGLNKLGEERKRLALLIEKKRAEYNKTRKAADEESQKAQDLADKAKSLTELIATMEREIAAAREAVKDAKEAEKKALQTEIATKKQKIAALKDAARLSPAIPFDKIKGLLRLPVEGNLVKAYGSPDGFGNKTQGFSLGTRSGAQVTSPADGWVVYSGPFRSFGKLLIINAGGGYHILLAGMDSLTAEVGQFILANEPIGQMKDTKLAQSNLLDSGESKPVLYMELRKNGVAIDPAPWWTVALKEKADG